MVDDVVEDMARRARLWGEPSLTEAVARVCDGTVRCANPDGPNAAAQAARGAGFAHRELARAGYTCAAMLCDQLYAPRPHDAGELAGVPWPPPEELAAAAATAAQAWGGPSGGAEAFWAGMCAFAHHHTHAVAAT